MRLARFNLFVETIESEERVTSRAQSIETYRRWDNIWYDKNNKSVDDDHFNIRLDEILDKHKPWKPRGGVTSYFPIPSLAAVVVATFVSSPKTTTRNRFYAVLNECLARANDAYNARYDDLTGVPNARALADTFKYTIVDKQNSTAYTDTSLLTETGDTSFTLIAIDIDHFKQVNDSYGHQYGDAVLRALAIRLETLASDLADTFDKQCEIFVARPHGEEFTVFVHGTITTEDIRYITDEFRSGIADKPIPDDNEWNLINQDGSDIDLTLPHINERRLTVSIGSASVQSVEKTDPDKLLSDLSNQADIALYRAKAGGRNRCRHFPDIRDKFGRVLEQHKDMNIITIDIGKQVNVKEGQEFLVFHPDFTGDKPFTYSDGRSERRLGMYPRVPCGRIVVFNVQEEISFCRVPEDQKDSIFPVGSLLEAIPVGTITHLLSESPSASGVSQPGLISPADMQKLISKSVENKEIPFIVTFELKNVSDLSNEKGSAFVNHILADLYRNIQENMPPGTRISQSTANQLSSFSETTSEFNFEHADNAINDIIATVEKRSGYNAKIIAGLASKFDEESFEESRWILENALMFSQYAASIVDPSVENMHVFTAATAGHVLSQARLSGHYSDALKDYERFIEAGMINSSLENQAGLAAFENEEPDFEFALARFNTAIELDDSQAVFFANRGIIGCALEDWELAYTSFVNAERLDFSFVKNSLYLAPLAFAAYKYYIIHPDQIDANVVEQHLKAAEAGVRLRNYSISRYDIFRALRELRARKSDSRQ